MSNTPFHHLRYDAVVVGARCAGASTAMLLARAGARVLVVDRHAYGTDTVSTHALMRGGVAQLARWGVLPRVMDAGTPRIARTTFHYGAEAIGVDIKAEHGVDYLCAPRRSVLDRVLVDAAKDAGAEVRHGISFADLRFGPDGRVTGAIPKPQDGEAVTVGAGVVIGADGRQSPVARRVGARTTVQGSVSSGYVYGYYADLPGDGYHWYFENGTAADTIPTNDGLQCVFTGVSQDRFASTYRGQLEGGFLRMAEANAPELWDAISQARCIGRLRGFAGGAGYLRKPQGRGWALVGDAGYFKDPLTVHGITDALRDAELLSRAVLDGRGRAFVRYEEERDTLSKPMLEVTDAIASFDWDMDGVKGLHARLSAVMKAETDHMAGSPATRAAA